MRSPFEVTKAVDLNDPQIERTYVAFAGRERAIVDPASPMPQFLTGVKGGGRTHLMRHFSFPLQKARGTRPLAEIQADGYLGVYFRCSGLNGSRFVGKGQSADIWSSAFAYYMDLWLSELLIATVRDVGESESWAEADVADVFDAVAGTIQLSADESVGAGRSLSDALARLSAIRGDLDWVINNAAHTGRLDINIRSNPGELVFRVCQAVSRLPGFEGIRVTFLADEYENLAHDQQIYFNTLIREKEAPATFLVGGRSWGIKTHRTLSAGEENKKGSEYEIYTIEDTYARDPKAYEAFCRELISVRLREFELSAGEAETWIGRLSFESDDRFFSKRLGAVLEKYAPHERPYLTRLHTATQRARSAAVADDVCAAVALPNYPLLEKLAVLKFYQHWASGQTPSAETASRARVWVEPLIEGRESTELANFFKQRKSDAVAQIYKEANRRTAYAGFSELVGMSGFLPRSLLMILKYVSHWADFHGEQVFSGAVPISERALSEGVLDAARWYLADAKPLGTEGEECEIAVRRLGVYLQSIRYSDKPSEIDITTFSSPLTGVSEDALRVLERCLDHGLLVEVIGGRAARNHGSQHRKFQLHPMLTPLWGLKPGRRGDATFSSETIEAIFSPAVSELSFSRARESLELALNAPFGRSIDTRDPLF